MLDSITYTTATSTGCGVTHADPVYAIPTLFCTKSIPENDETFSKPPIRRHLPHHREDGEATRLAANQVKRLSSGACCFYVDATDAL